MAGREGGGERDCAKIGRLPPSKLVGLEELCELFLPVCPPRIYERSVDALLAAAIQSLGVIEVGGDPFRSLSLSFSFSHSLSFSTSDLFGRIQPSIQPSIHGRNEKKVENYIGAVAI